jgi:hypothetical protein
MSTLLFCLVFENLVLGSGSKKSISSIDEFLKSQLSNGKVKRLKSTLQQAAGFALAFSVQLQGARISRHEAYLVYAAMTAK